MKEGQVTEAELTTEAAALARSLVPHERAQVVALLGDLGSGKTTFAQAFAASLGVKEHITSPTFVIEKRYRLEGQQFDTLIHIDAYRLDSSADLAQLHFEDSLSNPKNIIVLEWADRVPELIREDAIVISLSFFDEHTRTLFYGNR